ncbi:N-formylglutamate amidohydrolase [Aestuariibius sp. 2305UL40-4]|uniref:N-formylglutamate amidohydrolase n=1 Tax=Aestuariibius violaceus TaxID=3234132 RepID=UPI00345F0571
MLYSPCHITGADRPARWIVTCDHATNRVPDDVPPLGLPEEDMARHIAYDIGALGVAKRLGERLDGPVIWTDFSRLVIDPNRGEDDPTLVMRLYDGTIIPGNRHVDAGEVERRLNLFHRPYHGALEELASTRDALFVAVHSFTPQLKGRPWRPWEVGVLYNEDRQLAVPFLDSLRTDTDLCIGDNEPYSGHLPGDSMDIHGRRAGRPNVLIEIRNDLIETEAGQIAWADRLVPHLEAALAASGV